MRIFDAPDCFVATQLSQSDKHSHSAEMLKDQAFRYMLMFWRVPKSMPFSCKHERH